MLDRLPPPRLAFGALAATCFALLGFAYYAQYMMGLTPCPLCIFQRLAIAALGVVLLAAALHGAQGWGRRVWSLLAVSVAGVGAAIAGRHVWIQSLPADQVPSCGPGLDYLRETLPASEVIAEVLRGSGECALIDWTLLGLSMPNWTLLAFVTLGALAAWNGWRRA
jgi:disulfide bond formation protein DsbB